MTKKKHHQSRAPVGRRRRRRHKPKKDRRHKEQKRPTATSSDKQGSVVAVVVQNVLEAARKKENNNDHWVEDAFIELANAPLVQYHIQNNDKTTSTTAVTIRQDLTCTTHTGGIVWETAYLLCDYLSCQFQQRRQWRRPTMQVCELGAGCGLVGQVIHALLQQGKSKPTVVLTECPLVMPNLEFNVQQNNNNNNSKTVRAAPLDWTDPMAFIQDGNNDDNDNNPSLVAHSMDLLAGTDVLFSPALVEPLLQTMTVLIRKNSNAALAYLCVQERCQDSYRLLWDTAKDYGWHIEQVAYELEYPETCAWGKRLDCRLLKMTRILGDKDDDEKSKTTGQVS